MKIGIITVQKAPENYGACLQCFALWKYLKTQGYDCQVIDLMRPWSNRYIKSKIFPEKSCTKHTSIIRKVLSLLKGQGSKQEHNEPFENEMFKAFNGLIDYSKTYYSVDELYANPPEYDVYISGSDQIWNPLISFINQPYFLTFAPRNKRKISYASSFAVKEIPKGVWPLKLDWLSDFYSISVRESSGVSIVKDVFGRDATVVLDPTMLLTKTDWEEQLILPNEHGYFLVYTLQYNSVIVRHAKRLSKKYKVKLIIIVSSTTDNYIVDDDVTVVEAGPKEWLGYFYNADFIFTDSFHGSVFSILFQKNFVTICTNALVSERLQTLFESFCIQSNYITLDELAGIETIDSYNYNKEEVNCKLDTGRNVSREFLRNAIN